MAAPSIANAATASPKAQGQRLLVDTARMTVRKIAKSEQALLGALKTLGPVEKSTLVALVDTLGAKKRKRAPATEGTEQ